MDIGRVGEVTAGRPAWSARCSTTAASRSSPASPGPRDGGVYNVNADTAAAALAVALKAEKLVVLTDVEGLYRDWPNSDEVISQLDADDLEKLLPSLSAGMVPKMEACLHRGQAAACRSARARRPRQHAILLEVFTDAGIGTMVIGETP